MNEIEIETEIEMNEITPAQHYAAAMDSVNLINGAKPEQMDATEWVECIARNKEHLNIMLAKDFWTTEDLKPLQDAAV